ncbi:MAG TPA: DUF1761 domain-containing protein [Lacunisphaera sp.]|nr:DUF1761 domain-containing protein [Lacunisphaera sp.]
MTRAILTLNPVEVLTVAVIGFLLGWLWYSPLLFAKPWMKEMKITEEQMKASAQKGMARFFILAFLFTLLSTFGLAAFLNAHRPTWWGGGALVGGFFGLCVVGARLLNSGVWEQRSGRLLAINVGHEVALFAVQGTILAVWR